MSFIVGHSLAALAAARAPAGEKQRKLLYSPEVTLAVIGLALAPDLDILVWVLFHPTGMVPHRGFSHSLIVAIALAFIFWLLLSRFGKKGGLVLPLALVLASLAHPALDYLMGCGPRVPFFWPFNATGFLCPLKLVPTAYYALTLQDLINLPALMLQPKNLAGIMLEILIFLPILIAEKFSAAGKRLSLWLPCLGMSAGALAVVYLTYN